MIGIVGGTGPEGRGLGIRFALAGCDVGIGSRDAARAAGVAAELTELAGSAPGAGAIGSGENGSVAGAAELVVIAVPFRGQAAVISMLAAQLEGKVCVSTVSPLRIEKGVAYFDPPPEGSAAEQAAAIATGGRWTGGFHTIPAGDLSDLESAIDGDALVCSDDADALLQVIELAGRLPGVRGVNAGPLSSARYLEAATALMINVNRANRTHAALRVTGL